MNKYVFFAFKGEMMCFSHVLLNAIDMDSRKMDVKIVIEGEAVKLLEPLITSENPLFNKAQSLGLVDCVCKACSAKMGVLDYNEKSGVKLCDDLMGHPSMASYISDGYQVITL
jgi:hypothetical protein